MKDCRNTGKLLILPVRESGLTLFLRSPSSLSCFSTSRCRFAKDNTYTVYQFGQNINQLLGINLNEGALQKLNEYRFMMFENREE